MSKGLGWGFLSRDDWSKRCIPDAVTLFVGPEIPKLVRGIIDTDACSRLNRQPTLQRPDNAGGRVGSDVLMASVVIHLCHCNVSDAQITVRSLDTDGRDYLLEERNLVSSSLLVLQLTVRLVHRTHVAIMMQLHP